MLFQRFLFSLGLISTFVYIPFASIHLHLGFGSLPNTISSYAHSVLLILHSEEREAQASVKDEILSLKYLQLYCSFDPLD